MKHSPLTGLVAKRCDCQQAPINKLHRVDLAGSLLAPRNRKRKRRRRRHASRHRGSLMDGADEKFTADLSRIAGNESSLVHLLVCWPGYRGDLAGSNCARLMGPNVAPCSGLKSNYHNQGDQVAFERGRAPGAKAAQQARHQWALLVVYLQNKHRHHQQQQQQPLTPLEHLIEWRDSIINDRLANNGNSFASSPKLELKLIAPVACWLSPPSQASSIGYLDYLAKASRYWDTTDGSNEGTRPVPLCWPWNWSGGSRRQVYDYIGIDCAPLGRQRVTSTASLAIAGELCGPAGPVMRQPRRGSGDKCARARPCCLGLRAGRVGGARPPATASGLITGPGRASLEPSRPRPAPVSGRPRWAPLLLAALALVSAASTSIMDASRRYPAAREHDKLASAGQRKSEPPSWHLEAESGRVGQANVAATNPRGLNNDDNDDDDDDDYDDDNNIDATGTLWAAQAWRRNDDNNDNNANLDNANENDNYYDSSNHNGPRSPGHSKPLVGPTKRALPNDQDHDKLAPDKIDKEPPMRLDRFQAELGERAESPCCSDHVRAIAPEVATRRDQLRAPRSGSLFGELAGPAGKPRTSVALRAAAAAATAAAALSGSAAPDPPRGCPGECTCNWKNGKQFADCSAHQNKLVRLPVGLDPLTQVLNLSANHLVHLPQETFTSLQLNNLQRIYLSSCQLKSIHERAFDSLRLVVELDFSWNQLSRVPLAQISQLSLLRRLNMRGNPLGSLDELTYDGNSLAQDQEVAPSSLAALVETFPDLVRSYARQANQLKLDDAELAQLDQALDQLDQPGLDMERGRLTGRRQLGRPCCSLGTHFGQLQELDLGHCSLTYIKWTSFEQLDQLKRLWLDGNKLSQLSGRLMDALPVGLHQLSLEENPWICDCRLWALKRWLASSRTPLSAPVRCLELSTRSAGEQPAPDGDQQLEQLAEQHFVCPPKPAGQVGNLQLPALSELAGYLEPALVRRDSSGADSGPHARQSEARLRPANLQVNQGEKATLSCAFFVYPDSSADIIWLVDYYNQNQQRSGRSNHFSVLYDSRVHLQGRQVNGTSAPEKASTHKLDQSGWFETHLYGSRILVRESISSDPAKCGQSGSDGESASGLDSVGGNNIGPPELPVYNVLKESQLVIQRAHTDDSARYKCVALNRAGNSSQEFLFRVQADLSMAPTPPPPSSSAPTKWPRWFASPNSSEHAGTRDQRAHQEARHQASSSAQASSSGAPTLSSPSQASSAPSLAGAWLKGSTTFQVTIVIVSVLMGAVIVAFILFCVIIYQIKPSPGQLAAAVGALGPPTSGTPVQQAASPLAGTLEPAQSSICSAFPAPYMLGQTQPGAPAVKNASASLILTASCDPLTGSSPVHLLAGAHPLANSPGSSEHQEMQLSVNHMEPAQPAVHLHHEPPETGALYPAWNFIPQPSQSNYTSML